MARKDAKDRGLFERPTGIWWVRYSDANGIEHREKAGMKNAAIRLYKLRKREAREGVILPARKRKILFREILREGLQRSEARNASWKDDVNRAKDLMREFGERPAEEITSREIQAWMDRFKVERDLAPATINNYRALLSSVFSYAVQGERLNVNPVRNTKPLPVENSRVRFLTAVEEERLLRYASPLHQIEILFALNTGVRRAAQFNLKWEDYKDGVAFFPHTKNGSSQYVPINSYLRGLLAQGDRAGEYVFQKSHDELMSHHRLDWWYDLLDRAEIPNFRWHDLRHTFASRLIVSCNNIRTVQTALSHKTPQMTMRYAHLSDDHMRDALEGLVKK